ncbi:hypothetical protein [Exiguobacterium artemiae]
MSKNLQRLLFGKFCSLFAASLFTFVAGLTVLRETSSGLQFALVLLAGTLPRILLSPVAGVLSDRWNRKKSSSRPKHQVPSYLPYLQVTRPFFLSRRCIT